MAFIPVATAWVSEFWWMRAPVYFYLVVYTIWDFAYFLLTRIIYEDNVVKDPQGAAKLRKSKSYSKAQKSFIFVFSQSDISAFIFIRPLALV